MSRHVVTVPEHGRAWLDAADLTRADAERTISLYGRYFDVEPPSFKTDDRWSIASGSTIGFFPIRDELAIRVRPKVPIGNLFGMIERAYGLDIQSLKGTHDVEDLEDLYSRLAVRLARLVQGRVRRGLVRDYRKRCERLGFVRGRIDVPQMARRIDHSAVDCKFSEHTFDQHDNHVLLWTLHVLRRSPLRVDAAREVTRAYRAIASEVSVTRVQAQDAVRDHYDRMRTDYAPMHLLCRFFLEHCGPTHRAGASEMTPFLLSMPRLFEQFVAGWLGDELPEPYELAVQDRVYLDAAGGLHFDIDLVVLDRFTRSTLLVLDTKYKDHLDPSAADVHQAVAYAESKHCNLAALVYPNNGTRAPLHVGGKRVHRLAFDTSGDLELAGERFLVQVLALLKSQ